VIVGRVFQFASNLGQAAKETTPRSHTKSATPHKQHRPPHATRRRLPHAN
jgi:hypothetical protein